MTVVQLFAIYVLFTKNSYSIAGLALRDLMEVSNAGDRENDYFVFCQQAIVCIRSAKTNASVGWEWDYSDFVFRIHLPFCFWNKNLECSTGK